ncbi:MAG TPA: pseudouridine synthase [Draconibacterium sp.]|nr:pseudouridine synthase [Draconibacterium sp.]
MKNNYSRKSQNETPKGGKRIGKSLPPKTTGFTKGKSAPVLKSKPGDQKFVEAGKKRVYSKPKTTGLKNIPKKSNPTGEMQLNRFIANAGVCSRREADTYISAGMVSVNGVIITELGVKVLPTDEVRFDGTRLNPEKKVYLLLNKPKDFVTTTDDPHADKIVMDLIKDACPERIYPVGRLDRNTTGLLLFTNDGDLSKRLTHPSHTMKKVYQVSLDKPVTMDHLQQIADGIELEDGRIAADAISYISNEEKNEIGIEIHSGRNRIVRRIFEHFGYRVKKLDRVMYAGLTKKNLPRGKYRFLTEKEIQYLKMQ